MPQFPNWSRLIHYSELEDPTVLLPSTQGVYKLYWVTKSIRVLQYIGETVDLNRVLQYIGETVDLRQRLGHGHFHKSWWNHCQYSETKGYRESQRKDLEHSLISRHQPRYND